MKKELVTIKSFNLNKNMDVIIYGHYGVAILLFPSTTDDCKQSETEGLIESISSFINTGRCRVYSISAVNFESWLDTNKQPPDRSKRHFEFDKFITEEVISLIFSDTSGAVPIITAGAAIGAFHAANAYFKRPDLFLGTLAMSGTFNIQHFCGSYFDETCYFNSPIHYLPNLTDNYWLSFLQSRKHVHLLSGSGDNEFPGNSLHLSEILNQKSIPHTLDIWGPEWGHNPDTWKVMLQRSITKIL